MRMVRVEVAIKKRESHANVVYGITARERAVSIYLTIVILRFLNVNYLQLIRYSLMNHMIILQAVLISIWPGPVHLTSQSIRYSRY